MPKLTPASTRPCTISPKGLQRIVDRCPTKSCIAVTVFKLKLDVAGAYLLVYWKLFDKGSGKAEFGEDVDFFPTESALDVSDGCIAVFRECLSALGNRTITVWIWLVRNKGRETHRGSSSKKARRDSPMIGFWIGARKAKA
ncbi:MAG: hypothetical protein Q9167_006635 [Letrouitia subvulpina]